LRISGGKQDSGRLCTRTSLSARDAEEFLEVGDATLIGAYLLPAAVPLFELLLQSGELGLGDVAIHHPATFTSDQVMVGVTSFPHLFHADIQGSFWITVHLALQGSQRNAAALVLILEHPLDDGVIFRYFHI
ncbi:MAG: hypothetical protein NTU59_00525, partial [Coprothermobacterota bacterium]|nr:hypothetical protein [Coprothermobacterota bacterium]